MISKRSNEVNAEMARAFTVKTFIARSVGDYHQLYIVKLVRRAYNLTM